MGNRIPPKESFRNGVTFITDFEKAQLCYFHFVQSIWDHFQMYQKSQIISEFNSFTNLLPFIPEQKVTQVIDELYTYEETKRFAK